MQKARKICFDRLLPNASVQPQRTIMVDGKMRAVAAAGKQWLNGSTLRIRFMDGTPEQQDMVRQYATEWTEYANLNFEFTDDPQAEIRITFDPDDGAWSYVGTDNASIPLHAATMNLGWQDRGVILHEFGHMAGLFHEHQNPEGGIEWNEAKVIEDLSGPPNFWDEATIRHNVLNKYSADQVVGTNFDPQSVMLYAFPDDWTLNMGPTASNDELSEQDRAFIASAQMYPGRDTGDTPNVQDLEIHAAAAQEISQPGEEDVFAFTVTEQRRHVIETTGTTDVVMVLFGPDNPNNKLAEDDDGGQGRNARIDMTLQPGEYRLAMRHYNPNAQGAYNILATAL